MLLKNIDSKTVLEQASISCKYLADQFMDKPASEIDYLHVVKELEHIKANIDECIGFYENLEVKE